MEEAITICADDYANLLRAYCSGDVLKYYTSLARILLDDLKTLAFLGDRETQKKTILLDLIFRLEKPYAEEMFAGTIWENALSELQEKAAADDLSWITTWLAAVCYGYCHKLEGIDKLCLDGIYDEFCQLAQTMNTVSFKTIGREKIHPLLLREIEHIAHARNEPHW